MVSRYCQDAGDWKGAIEFLLMAKRTTDAFSLAKSHGQMDVFTKVYEYPYLSYAYTSIYDLCFPGTTVSVDTSDIGQLERDLQ